VLNVVVTWQMREQTVAELGHQSVRGLSIMESTLRGLKRFLFFQPIAFELESGGFSTTALNPCLTLSHVPNYSSGPRAASVFAHRHCIGLIFHI
jgi:hypothetical protein